MQHQFPDCLSDILGETLEGDNIGVCVKDANKMVLMQNKNCLKHCGNQLGKPCYMGCMELYDKDKEQQWDGWGTRMYKNTFAHGTYFDMMLICSDKHLITFLLPLEEKQNKGIEFYHGKGLTKRELTVMALAVHGNSNQQMCEELSISKATLRTHLNNVYRKVRDTGEIPSFIPANRAQNKLASTP